MIIGIDISQTVYRQTGVSNYLENLIDQLIQNNPEHTFKLFGSSLRKHDSLQDIANGFKNTDRVRINLYYFPPMMLHFLWNVLHILPIEWFIGNSDIFLSSDWTQPPTRKAKKATILYDLIVYKYPKETAALIVQVQKRRLRWVKKETDIIFCISESTKQDAMEILHIPSEKLHVCYPGVTL